MGFRGLGSGSKVSGFRFGVPPDCHARPFVGVSEARSWSHWLVFVGKYRQQLITLMEIDVSNTLMKGLAWQEDGRPAPPRPGRGQSHDLHPEP